MDFTLQRSSLHIIHKFTTSLDDPWLLSIQYKFCQDLLNHHPIKKTVDTHVHLQVLSLRPAPQFVLYRIRQTESSFTVCTECHECPSNIKQLCKSTQLFIFNTKRHHGWECWNNFCFNFFCNAKLKVIVFFNHCWFFCQKFFILIAKELYVINLEIEPTIDNRSNIKSSNADLAWTSSSGNLSSRWLHNKFIKVKTGVVSRDCTELESCETRMRV